MEGQRQSSKNETLTWQIALRVLLELRHPLVEVFLLLLAVLERSSLQLRVVSLRVWSNSQPKTATFYLHLKGQTAIFHSLRARSETEGGKHTMNNSSSVGVT